MITNMPAASPIVDYVDAPSRWTRPHSSELTKSSTWFHRAVRASPRSVRRVCTNIEATRRHSEAGPSLQLAPVRGSWGRPWGCVTSTMSRGSPSCRSSDPSNRMDDGHGPIRHPVRRALSRNLTMTTETDIATTFMIAWPAPSPSMPPPRRFALGLDRSARRSTVADRAAADVSISCTERNQPS